jgi:hypothetical protein
MWHEYLPTSDKESYNKLVWMSEFGRQRDARDSFDEQLVYVNLLTGLAIELAKDPKNTLTPVRDPVFRGGRCLATYESDSPYVEILGASFDLAISALRDAVRFIGNNQTFGEEATIIPREKTNGLSTYAHYQSTEDVVAHLLACGRQLLLLKQVVFSVWKYKINATFSPMACAALAHSCFFAARALAVSVPCKGAHADPVLRRDVLRHAGEALRFLVSKVSPPEARAFIVDLSAQFTSAFYMECAAEFEHGKLMFENAVWCMDQVHSLVGKRNPVSLGIARRANALVTGAPRGMFNRRIPLLEVPTGWLTRYPDFKFTPDVDHDPPDREDILKAGEADPNDFHRFVLKYEGYDVVVPKKKAKKETPAPDVYDDEDEGDSGGGGSEDDEDF